MKWIVFGDLHLNKPFPKLRANKDKCVEDLYAEGINAFVTEIVSKIQEQAANVVFLGDITHYNQDKFERFLFIVDNIIKLRPNYKIFVVIGNHDTSNSFHLEKAKINKLYGYRDRLFIVNNVTMKQYNNTEILFLPYIKTELIKPTITQFNYTKPLVILSHNNIYTSDEWYSKETVPFREILDIYDKAHLINGHIHRYFIQNQYYQIGSAAPTSFKEYYQAVGCCVFDDIDLSFSVFKNTHIFFLSVSDINYINEAKTFLENAQKHDAIVFLRSPFEKLYKYKCVGAVYESKQQES